MSDCSVAAQSDKTLGVGKNYQPNFGYSPVVGSAPVLDLPEITYDQQVHVPNIRNEAPGKLIAIPCELVFTFSVDFLRLHI